MMVNALLEQPTPITHLLSINSDDYFIYVYNTQGQLIVEIDFHLLAEGILNDTWYGVVFNDEYISFLDGIYLEIFNKFRFTKKLCNIKKLESTFDGINEWFCEIYYPKLVLKGLKYNAVVMPEGLCAQHSVMFYMEKIKHLAIENQVFNSEEDALLWLFSRS